MFSQLVLWQIRKLSTLSVLEVAELKTTLHVMDNERFQCGKCLKKYESRQDGKKLLKKLRKLQGCFGTSRKIGYSYDNYIYSTCPGNLFNTSSIFIIDLYREYQKGVLPYAGSLVEQPAKVMEAFSIIDSYNHKKMIEEQKKQRELQSRGRSRLNNRR